MGQWLNIDDLVFVTDSVFAYNLVQHQLGLTVLRIPIYGDLRLDDQYLDPVADYDILSQGITEGSIRVCFDKGAVPHHLAEAFNNPPVVLCEANHSGTKPPCFSFASTGTEKIHLTTLKHPEDGNGLILRGASHSEDAETVNLRVLNREHEITLAPHEIFTLRIQDNTATTVNILEE